MKKLLSILGTIGLTATGTSSVIACGKKAENKDTKNHNLMVVDVIYTKMY